MTNEIEYTNDEIDAMVAFDRRWGRRELAVVVGAIEGDEGAPENAWSVAVKKIRRIRLPMVDGSVTTDPGQLPDTVEDPFYDRVDFVALRWLLNTSVRVALDVVRLGEANAAALWRSIGAAADGG